MEAEGGNTEGCGSLHILLSAPGHLKSNGHSVGAESSWALPVRNQLTGTHQRAVGWVAASAQPALRVS